MTQNSNPLRILIVRLSAIGDVVQSTPIAWALRDAFPDAKIVWAVQSGQSALLEGHPAIDDLLVVSRRWMFAPREILAIWREMRLYRFDIAIDAQGLTKSAMLARLSGARRRIGFGEPWGRELSPWLNTELVDTTDCRHIVDRNMRILKPLLGPLGIDEPNVRFDMPTYADASDSVDRLLGELEITRPFVCLNVGAGWASKRWPPDRFAELAEHLHTKHGLKSTVVAGRGDERVVGEQTAAMAGDCVRLVPPISLQELAELARRACLFVGSDTGPLHIAAAVDTPCVGLYGPFPAERHGPWGDRNVAIQKMCLDGPVRERRHAGPECMEAIDVATVCQVCDEQLAKYL